MRQPGDHKAEGAGPPLRLAGTSRALNRSPLRVQKRAPRPSDDHQRAVARSNAESSTLSMADARWAFAVRVASSLEGGRAGILRPASRERLVTQAGGLGLRPFDANLVIAIVQDSARTFGSPLGEHAADRLRLVRDPREAGRTNGLSGWWNLALAGVLASAMAWTAIRWLVG